MATDPARATFIEKVRPFLEACPGPAVARAGLRHAALQRVKGIPGLDARADDSSIEWAAGSEGRYLHTINDMAELLGCSAAHLSESARRRGYHYSLALRWIRFLHFVSLRTNRCPTDEAAWRLGFNDVAGLTRFVAALHGRTVSQLPSVPFAFWVRRAIEDVYLGSPGKRARAETLTG